MLRRLRRYGLVIWEPWLAANAAIGSILIRGRTGGRLILRRAGWVVFDLVQFTRFEQDPQLKGKKGERRTPSYVGFVLGKGRPVRSRRVVSGSMPSR